PPGAGAPAASPSAPLDKPIDLAKPIKKKPARSTTNAEGASGRAASSPPLPQVRPDPGPLATQGAAPPLEDAPPEDGVAIPARETRATAPPEAPAAARSESAGAAEVGPQPSRAAALPQAPDSGLAPALSQAPSLPDPTGASPAEARLPSPTEEAPAA